MDAEKVIHGVQKEPEPVMQKDSDSVLTAATNVLQGILDSIDDQHSTTAPEVPSSRTNVTTRPESGPLKSPEGIPEETPEGTPLELITEADPNFDEDRNPSKKSGGTDLCPSEGDVVSSVSLPHEGERWARLRNQVIGLPYFKGYLSRTDENLSWSVDEAFASFCLDRIEQTLTPADAKPSESIQPKTVKKVTRRKGKPQKYERQETPMDEDTLGTSRKRKGKENGLRVIDYAEDNTEMSLEEEENEDEDMLAMDDNPSDLDYQPVPIIRYPKRRRKSLPRNIKNRVSPKTTIRAKKITENDKPPKKKAPPKKPTKSPKKTPKLERIGPPRKRGRPKKVVPEKFHQSESKAEKTAKQYVRMEVRLQRLPKMYECKTCFEQFPEAEDVKKHFLGVHRRESTPFHPQNNGTESLEGGSPDPTTSESELLLADVTKLATLLRQCPKCKKFVDNMTVHKREHRERNFICEECGKGFTENQILQKHKKVHEMDRTGDRYKCELCDKSYRFSQNLRSHQLYHGGEKTFICDHCGKSFYTNNRLIIHSAIHMKEKPYKCSECGRGFSQKSNMQKHERVHTGVKPYQCELCMESFNHKVSLKNHKKKHHGIDWWKDVGRPKPATTRRPRDTTHGVIVNREQHLAGQTKQNAVQLNKEQPALENQWKGGAVPLERENNSANHWRDDRQPVREMEQVEGQWHRQENELAIDHQNQADEAVRLQTLQQAGNQWKGSNVPMERQGQAGDPGMAAFFYPSTYIQGYPSGYAGMPVIPLNTDTSVHPVTRPPY